MYINQYYFIMMLAMFLYETIFNYFYKIYIFLT